MPETTLWTYSANEPFDVRSTVLADQNAEVRSTQSPAEKVFVHRIDQCTPADSGVTVLHAYAPDSIVFTESLHRLLDVETEGSASRCDDILGN